MFEIEAVDAQWGIGIGKLPERKRIALYRRFQDQYQPLAWFNSEQDAECAIAMLEKIAERAGFKDER